MSIKNILKLLLLFLSLIVNLEADCTILQMRDILPASKEVGEIDQARLDSGPTFGDYGETIFTRSWHGGGNYRNLNITLTIYPDNKSAYKEAQKYCKELGSRKIVLPYADIGCTHKSRYYTRRYYKLARKCAVIQLFSSYPQRGLVEPQDYILKSMIDKIDKLSCLCPADEPPANPDTNCSVVKEIQITPPIVNKPIKLTAIVENEENIEDSFWEHNPKYEKMFMNARGGHKGENYTTLIFEKTGCVEMTYNVISKNPECKPSKKSIKFFVTNNPHIKNHLPTIQKIKQYIAITAHGKFAVVELTLYDADGDTITILPTKKNKFYIENLGKNRFRLSWEIEQLPHGEQSIPMEIYDNSCTPTIKTLTINRDTMPIVDYTKDNRKDISVNIIQLTDAIENKDVCFKADISGVDSKNRSNLIYNWSLDGTPIGSTINSVCVKTGAGTHKIELLVSAKGYQGKSILEFFVSKDSVKDTGNKKTSLIDSVKFTTIDGKESSIFKANKNACLTINLLPLSRVHTVAVRWINPKGKSKSIQEFSTKITAASGRGESLQSCFIPQEAGEWSVEVLIDGNVDISKKFKVVSNSSITKITKQFKNSNNRENWANSWRVVSAKNIDNASWVKSYNISANTLPSGAKKNLFVIPLNKQGASVAFEKNLNVNRKDKSLAFRVLANRLGIFAIEVEIDGKRAFKRTVNGLKWYELTVPLQKYYGKNINVKVKLSYAGGGVAYVDYFGLVDTQHKNRYGFDINTNRPGATYKSFELPKNDAMLCKKACDKQKRCKAWVFVKETSNSKPKCLLKDSVTQAVLDPYTVSGVKTTLHIEKTTNSYIGCFKDQGNPFGVENRDLNKAIFSKNDMTISKCIDYCKSKGFKYAGLQYSSYCFCGNSYGKYGKANNCNMKCAGDANEICGGFWANSIYSTQTKKGIKPHNLNNQRDNIIYNSGDSGENFLDDIDPNNISEDEAFKPQKGNLIDLQDRFNNTLNSSIWEVYEWKTLKRLSGNNLVHNGYLDLQCNKTDRSAFIATKPIHLKNDEVMHIKMRIKVHYANKYYEGGVWFYATDVGKKVTMPKNPNAWLSAFGKNLFNVTHYHYYYEKPGVTPYVPARNGFAIYSMNWRKEKNYGIIGPIWDRWFIEDIYYYPAKRVAILKVGNKIKKVYTPPYNKDYIRFIIHPYGWYTGHSLQVDWIRITVRKADKM